MKTLNNNLFDKIVSKDNLRQAHRMARRGKSRYTWVKKINKNEDYYIDKLHEMLVSGKFTTSEYEIETTNKGGKERILHKLPYYPDRVVQHAIVLQCEQLWKSRLIRDTFQSIKGRGGKDCFLRVKGAMSTRPKYAIKLDIVKFYPSVRSEHLDKLDLHRISCPRTVKLLRDIIYSLDQLPLGNHISQYLGNLLLTPLDWKCKQELGIKHYFRYCDDIVIMSDSKEDILRWREVIKEELNKIDLQLKDNLNILDLSKHGLNFVGYTFHHDYIKVGKKIANNFKQTVRRGDKKALPSYWGWCKQSRSYSLYNTYIGRYRNKHESRK